MGKLIVIESCNDCIGKATQYRLLVERLRKDSNKVITTHHFPSYGTYQGRPVEEYLKGNYGKISELSQYFVNSLYAQDRAITWNTGLKQEYEKGGIIVADRYTTSSLIYQSAAIEDLEEREKFIDYIYDYEYNRLGLPVPDLVIFLYAPFDIFMKIKGRRKKNYDDIYKKDMEFMENISNVSILLAKRFNWSFVKCVRDGELLSPNEIHEEIYKLVSKIV